jgi:hypothetical protein
MTNPLVEKVARALQQEHRRNFIEPRCSPAPDYDWLDEARAAIASIPTAQGWRDIESAPKDGTRILGYLPETDLDDDYYAPEEVMVVAWERHYQHGDGWLIDREEQFAGWCNPTHWQSLPEPPIDQALASDQTDVVR